MQTLQKITTEFVEIEDRFKLTAVSGEGEIVVLWLTQRLLGKLVDHCTKWLTQVMPDLAKSAVIAKESRDQVQTFVQQSAQEEIAEEVAVVAQPQSKAFLVLEVDLKFNKNNLVIIFKSGQKVQSGLTLTIKNLRQWLSIVYKLWRKADWPSSIWPDWINTSEDSLDKSNTAVH